MDKKFLRKNGYNVIIPHNSVEPIPIECPVCSILMGQRDDLVSYSRWKCCSWCERMWISESKHDAWRAGWRPDPQVVKSTLSGLGMIIDNT